MANEQARPSLQTFPPELRERIFSFVVCKKDLSSIRLSCRAFVADVTQFLFAEVRLLPRLSSMSHLTMISGFPTLARHVQSFELCFDCTPEWLLSSNRQGFFVRGGPGFQVWDNIDGHGRLTKVSKADWRKRLDDEMAFQCRSGLVIQTYFPGILQAFHRLRTVRLAGPAPFLTEVLKQCDLAAEPRLAREFEDWMFFITVDMYCSLLQAIVDTRTVLEEIQMMDSFVMISRLLSRYRHRRIWENTVSICASAKRLHLSTLLSPWRFVPPQKRPPSPFPIWFLDVPPVLRENNSLQELILILNEDWWVAESFPGRLQNLKHLLGPLDNDEQAMARRPWRLPDSELLGSPNLAAFDSLTTLELRGVGVTFAGLSDILPVLSSRLTRLALCHVSLEGGCWVSAIKLLHELLTLKHVLLHGLRSESGTWYGYGLQSSPMSWQPNVACNLVRISTETRISPWESLHRDRGRSLGQRLLDFILNGSPCPLSSLADDCNAERQWHEQSDGSFSYIKMSVSA